MKMNNKGFAISTVIYGLSIMGVMIVSILMGTMSTTRKNTKELSKSIEEELNRYSKTNTTFKVKGTSAPEEQPYTVPEGQGGWYRVELWGAQGGSNGGLGAYTSGIIKLDEGETLYFYIGRKGNGSTGGESTDVRTENGEYTSRPSYNNRIMVAAGGGVSSNAHGGTMYGGDSSQIIKGGQIDIGNLDALDGTFTLEADTTLAGYPKGFVSSSPTESNPVGSSGGGGGYQSSNNANIGGSSYISGYAGQEPQQQYFLDGQMYAGVNSGDGFAKIEKVKDVTDENSDLTIKNQKMTNVTAIRDCISNNDPIPSKWKIYAMSKGEVVNVPNQPYNSIANYRCKTSHLNSATFLDEIAVFHTAGVDYHNHTIEVKQNNGEWQYLKKPASETQLSETESPTGIRISAYQPDNTEPFTKTGNYHIVSVLNENKCLTIENNSDIKLDYFNGSNRQVWSIEEIDSALKKQSNSSEYRITEAASFKSLAIAERQNIIGNKIEGIPFNQITREESTIWKINHLGNGTYAIQTIEDTAPELLKGKYIVSAFDENTNTNTIIIGRNNLDVTRFKLISLDY